MSDIEIQHLIARACAHRVYYCILQDAKNEVTWKTAPRPSTMASYSDLASQLVALVFINDINNLINQGIYMHHIMTVWLAICMLCCIMVQTCACCSVL